MFSLPKFLWDLLNFKSLFTKFQPSIQDWIWFNLLSPPTQNWALSDSRLANCSQAVFGKPSPTLWRPLCWHLLQKGSSPHPCVSMQTLGSQEEAYNGRDCSFSIPISREYIFFNLKVNKKNKGHNPTRCFRHATFCHSMRCVVEL